MKLPLASLFYRSVERLDQVPVEQAGVCLHAAVPRVRNHVEAHAGKQGFEPVDEEIRTLEFAETLGVGSTKTKNAKIIPVD